MSMATPRIIPILRCTRTSNLAQFVKALIWSRQVTYSQARHKSILCSAICVERHPVVTPTKPEVEVKFSEILSKIEQENSYLSDHEVRHIKEVQAAKIKQENAEEDQDTADTETITALDLEDKWDAEIKEFTPAPCLTQSDRYEDLKSLRRKLDSSLYLLVKQSIHGRDHWVLPQATWEEGEALRQTAERALSSITGDVSATVLGNAPCAVAEFDLPSQEKGEDVKIFFFKAWYREGNVNTEKGEASDYAWVTQGELKDFCHNRYNRQLKKFICEI